jgi:hypothetical protein
MHYKHSFTIFLVIYLQKKQSQTTYFELSYTCAKLLFFHQSEEIVILWPLQVWTLVSVLQSE